MRLLKKLFSKPLFRIPFIIGVMILAYFIFLKQYNFLPVGKGQKWNKGQNGIWLSRYWMREPVSKMSDEEVRAKLTLFRKNGISYLYPHCCPMDEKGNLPQINDEATSRVLSIASEFGNYFKILPWVGGSLDTIGLDDMNQCETWCNQVKDLVERFNFPGVNVNIEPLEHDDDRIFEWIAKLRGKLGSERMISFCGIRPETGPLKDNWGKWTAEDYTKLAECTDQITVMAYDTGRKIPYMFTQWNYTQFNNVYDAVKKSGNANCQILWGIPTYEDKRDYFFAEAENVRTSLRSLIQALNARDDLDQFQGIAIYSDWVTGEKEWQTIISSWGNEESAD